ncbi:hypothetical protein ACWC9S_27160 [Streptomyces xiamenensis]
MQFTDAVAARERVGHRKMGCPQGPLRRRCVHPVQGDSTSGHGEGPTGIGYVSHRP